MAELIGAFIHALLEFPIQFAQGSATVVPCIAYLQARLGCSRVTRMLEMARSRSVAIVA